MTVLVATEQRLPDLAGVDRWLYAGSDPAWRIAAENGPLAGIPRVDVADTLQRAAHELRRPFLDRFGELGARNDGIEWWASALGARTSFTRFYDRVCMLAAAREALAQPWDGTTLAVCSTVALADELARATGADRITGSDAPARPGGRVARAWVRRAPERLLSAAQISRRDSDPRYRRRVLARLGLLEPRPFAGPGTALLLTWIDGRSFAADGTYADPHLGPLAELLRERGLEVAFVARVLPSAPFAETVARLAASGEAFLFPDAFLELDDHRDCARRAAAFAPEIPDSLAVEDVRVAALAREVVEHERGSQAQALLLEPLARRLAAAGVRPERIIHTCEGHAWELVLAWAARRHLPETEVVGYENLNMSRLGLSMFPAPAELGVRPLPHRIVTNGPAFRDVLVEEGVPEALVRTGCGLRHRALWEAAVRQASPGRPLQVLAATEIALGPSVELIDKAAAAFAGDPAHELVVKCHPLVSRAEIERLLGSRTAGLRFDERPTLELLAESDVLLYTYTGVSFEALALGVPPVFVRSESSLDLDQLEFAADLHLEARTPEEIRNAVAEIAALAPDVLAAWRAVAREAAARALSPVRPECVEAFL